MFIPILLFTVGLFLLIKGGDMFVDGSVGIAKYFKVPELIIGATVVSLGTTLPEVSVSVISALNGHGELSYGNAIGSVICNTALIAAISILIRPCTVETKPLRTPVLFFFISTAIYTINVYYLGFFGKVLGCILLGIFVLYMVVTVKSALKEKDSVKHEVKRNLMGNERLVLIKDFVFLIVGSGIIAIGSNLLVDNGVIIAEIFGVPESVIALTFIALGTSLPELVTAITSLIKGHGALSLGNIVGANLFNIVLVSGLSMMFSPFEVPSSKELFGINSSLILDIPLIMFVMVFLTLPAFINGKLSRFQGVILLLIYAVFCIVQFSL